MSSTTPPVVLAIGGSDSGAGAGIQADIKAIAANGGYAATVITAVTAQNTLGVRGVHPIPVQMVRDQIGAVLEDLPVAAVKTGYLGRGEVVEAIAGLVPPGVPLVVDPVLVNAAGTQIVDDDTVAAYLEVLAPAADLLTPNFREAAILSGIEVVDVDSMESAALAISERTGGDVLVTGGHLATPKATDVLVIGGEVTRHTATRIETRNVHGTGCSTASAIAAWLAAGRSPRDAYRQVKMWLIGALAGSAAWELGAGQGPLDHFGWNPPAD